MNDKKDYSFNWVNLVFVCIILVAIVAAVALFKSPNKTVKSVKVANKTQTTIPVKRGEDERNRDVNLVNYRVKSQTKIKVIDGKKKKEIKLLYILMDKQKNDSLTVQGIEDIVFEIMKAESPYNFKMYFFEDEKLLNKSKEKTESDGAVGILENGVLLFNGEKYDFNKKIKNY